MKTKTLFPLGKFFKKISWKRWLCLLLLCYLGALVIPYLPHKKVSPSDKAHFSKRTFQQSGQGSERISYIDDNTDALLYRLRMLQDAKEEVILSTFDFNADQAGKDILSALLKTADRGVTVKIIVDGFSGLLDLRHNDWFKSLAAHEKVSIKVYNPIHFLKPWKMQARLHDKYLIIDRKMYLLGGRNTTNLFLGNYTRAQNIDRELFVCETKENSTDSSVSQLLDYFAQIWNLPDSKDYLCSSLTPEISEKQDLLHRHYRTLKTAYAEAFHPWNWEEKTFSTNKVSLLTNPVEAENKSPWMWYSLHQLMTGGKQVTIYTPYIICGKEMYQDLHALTTGGTDLEIITNDVASGANPWGCTDYLNQKKNIHATGAKVYEFMGTHSCHTKAVLIDENLSVIGSYNLDMRSTYQDTELMLVVDSPKLNAMIRQEAARDKTYSKIQTAENEYTYGENYHAKPMSAGKKIFYGLFRVIVMPIRRFL